ncbi:uncharacterized protein ACRADG_010675 [Cochliomyia hominivorax]
MKTLCLNFDCKLYKLGLLIGFTHLIPSFFISLLCIINRYNLPVSSIITACTSILLIVGLTNERFEYLVPWLIYIPLTNSFNAFLVIAEFGKLHWERSFNFEVSLYSTLVIQILSWYCIFCLAKKGHQNKKLLTTSIETISKEVTQHPNDKGFYNINLTLNSSEQKN